MSITEAVTALGLALKKRCWRLVTAESCTGGGLSYGLTAVPGSSEWFDCGFVTYSNGAKEKCLGVSALTLAQYGAVSAQAATEMAEGALQHSEAQLSLAITGIAGPDGGSPEKPVGTVWFAWKAINHNTETAQAVFSGNRQAIREQAIQFALDCLQKYIDSSG